MNHFSLDEDAGRVAAERAADPTRVLVADGRLHVRGAVEAMLSTLPGVTVVAAVGRVSEALDLALDGQADTVVIDPMQLSGAGMEVVRVIKAHRPKTRVVVLTGDPSCRDESAEAGVDSFLVKGCSMDELADAITTRQSTGSGTVGAR